MALPAVYFLVLFSMLPLLQASRCPRGSFCPMGYDCDKDLNLCQSGMCTNGANRSICDNDITIEFTRPVYPVIEGGQIDAILRISKPLDCCPFSVQIRVEQETATGADFDYPRGGYIQVVFPPAKKLTVIIPLKTKDDKISERPETFRLSIVDISLPHGVSVGSMRSAEVEIVDNDPVCVRFDRPSYTVSENSPLSVTLVLTAAASYDISVEITTVTMEATAGCDFDDRPVSVLIKSGSTRTTFKFDINDDDVHEASESFNLVIGDVTSPATHCNSYRTTITIRDNEPQISMSFDRSSYVVDEDGGSISPVLELSEPAPCCITVYVELTDKTATGEGVDYGNQDIDMYEYTFSAGETCSTPTIPISIINDTTSEKDETFTISVIEISVPFNVRLSRKSAQITIKDNDIEVCFEESNYEIIETDGPLKIRLELDKPAVEDTTILVFDIPETAIPGEDYVREPYDITFKKNQRKSEPFDIIINKTDGYTGNKIFQLTISFGSLNNGLVACLPPSVPVTILDSDYGVCFHTDVITVIEGERVELLLATTRKLSRSLSVKLLYGGVDGYPYTASNSGSDSDYTPVPRTSITTTKTIFIYTKGDNRLERDERFSIAIDPEILPAGLPPTCHTEVVVTILNDDGSTVYFEKNSFATVNKNELVKPVIMFSNQIDYKVEGHIITEDDTAVNNEDYHILNDNPIHFGPGRRKLLSVDAVDDDIVEELKEYFKIRLVDIYDPNIYIDEARNYTEITIHDDDISEVQIIQDRLDFTKGIYQDCTVRVEYTGNPVLTNYTLPSGNRTIGLNGDVKLATVCIPNILYDERRSSFRNNKPPVLTTDRKVKIIPLRDC